MLSNAFKSFFWYIIIIFFSSQLSYCALGHHLFARRQKKKNKKNQFDFYPSVYGSIMLFVKLVFSGNCTLRASKAVRSRTFDENGPKTWCATDYDFFFLFYRLSSRHRVPLVIRVFRRPLTRYDNNNNNNAIILSRNGTPNVGWWEGRGDKR